jgi:hypothetical protein
VALLKIKLNIFVNKYIYTYIRVFDVSLKFVIAYFFFELEPINSLIFHIDMASNSDNATTSWDSLSALIEM